MLDHNGVPTVSWTWEEGKYFDLWMLVHLLTGVVIGISAHLVGFSPLVAYTGTFVGLTLYEVVEEVFRIEETLENRLADIVFGSIGFVLFYQLLSPLWSLQTNQIALIGAGLLMGIGAVLGWRAYKHRGTT